MVIGASGGCGIAGLQIAQYMGASDITAVTSTKNRELVLREGANGFLDYTVADIAERCGPEVSDHLRFDVVYDCASGSGEGENYRESGVTCLREPDEHEGRPHGQYVATNGANIMWMRMYTIGQRRNEHLFLNKPNTADLNLIAELVDGGVLNPVVMKAIPLTSQAELVRALALFTQYVVLASTLSSSPLLSLPKPRSHAIKSLP